MNEELGESLKDVISNFVDSVTDDLAYEVRRLNADINKAQERLTKIEARRDALERQLEAYRDEVSA